MGSMIKFGKDLTPVMKLSILTLIFFLGFIVRVFSVLRFESIIHEFDPWFNFRTTKFLDQKGWYEFWNWYDSESWYPLESIHHHGPTLGKPAPHHRRLQGSLPLALPEHCS